MNLPAPIVYCISEGRATEANFDEVRSDILLKIRNAGDRGVAMFQVREKSLPADLLFQLAKEAVQAAGPRVKVLVNDRLDIALAAGAAGVHLPTAGLPILQVKPSVPPGYLVVVSTHTADDVECARDAGADMAVFGPVFASPGKGEGIGLESLKNACADASPMPVLALGGVEESNLSAVIENGAAGYAAIRYLNELLS